jgi:hypothetical protein
LENIMPTAIAHSSKPKTSNPYFSSTKANPFPQPTEVSIVDSYVPSVSQGKEGINWSQGTRVAAKLALFAAPAALGAASGSTNLAMVGMLGSMSCAVATSARTNDDNMVLLQGFGAVVGTAIAAAAGGLGGYTGAAVVIGGLAGVGGLMAALTPSGDPNLPYAR